MNGGIVVLTGAGISAESGLRTFRAADGLWEEHRIEDVASLQGFTHNPELVYHFYNERRRALANATPNAAHIALAEFESQYADDFLLITQNIDDLHERAGSRRLYHMHGELLKMRCTACNTVTQLSGDLSASNHCPHCKQTGNCRPDIVWFGEMPYYMDEIQYALQACQWFISIGTSGSVYPAAGFIQIARLAGAHCVQLNLENTGGVFDQSLYGKATDIVPAFFNQIRF